MTPFRASSLLALGLLTVGVARAVPTPRPVLRAPTAFFVAAAPLIAPTVPASVEFAGLQLDLTDGGRAAVQRLVDALYRHPTYLQQKVERADTYFPIIDRVFKEEGVPNELRYLALQESGLVSDAVSTSNAVGFWQMKKEAAADFNLRVNAEVDERRHIVESSRGAARYFKRSNAQLNNWVNSLMSYYTGLGGAKRLVSPADAYARRMTITETTHPYVITFIAHKLAFEGQCGLNPAPALRLEEVKARPGQTLDELAASLSANPAEVSKYNKWLLAPAVPADKQYSVLVPVTGPAILVAAVETPVAELAFPTPPPVDNPQLPPPEVTQVNGLKAVVARKGDTPDILALVVGMDTKRFRYLNDLSERDGVVEGRPYYLQKKRNRAVAEYHVAQPGETVVQISQQYGVKAKMVLKKNRMTASDPLQPGRLLWLQHTRPVDVPIEFMSIVPAAPAVAAAPATSSLPPVTAVAAPETATDTADTDDIPPVAAAASQPVVTSTTPPAANATTTAANATTAAANATTAAANTTATAANTTATAVNATATAANTTATTANATAIAANTTATAANANTTAANAPSMSSGTAKPVGQPLPTAPPAPTTAMAQPLTGQSHIVVKGETLSALARQYGVTVKDLMTWNSLASPNLRLGQLLRISAPAPGTAPVAPAPTPPTVDEAGVTRHTVAAGESLYRLAKQYGVSVQQLMEWNSLPDFNVKLGQQLIVSKK